MRVSLVMPTLNAGELLERVLEQVDAQPGARDLQKIAIDSGSTDGTVARLERHGFTVDAIDKRDFNHGTTRDLGIGKATGEVVVLLTQDAVPADDQWLQSLVTAYDDPSVAAAYCRQIPRDDCNPLIRKRILDWAAGRSERVVQHLDVVSGDGDLEAALAKLEPMQRLEMCAYDNVAGSVRRSVWEEIPFGFRRFGEDVAFGKRVILSGRSIVYEPRSAVIHSHNRSPKDEGKRIFCDHQNLKELFGIHVLPTYEHYRDAVKSGQEEFRGILANLSLEAVERKKIEHWADQYAKWSALGIYLGGNADRFRNGFTGLFFGLVERHLRRGI